MLDDIWEIFAATGYKRIIASSKETCANKEQRISNNANHNQPQCAELCEQTEDCRFYFINIQNRCNLYSSCSKRRVASYRGSTFEKMAGNYLKYVVNDIWSRIHYHLLLVLAINHINCIVFPSQRRRLLQFHQRQRHQVALSLDNVDNFWNIRKNLSVVDKST